MRPMLAYHLSEEDLDNLKYPFVLQRKYNGFRAIFDGKKFVTRSGKPIANTFTNMLSEHLYPNILDGELVFGASFEETTSFFRSHEQRGTVTYVVYDLPSCPKGTGYAERYAMLQDWFQGYERKHENFVVELAPAWVVSNRKEVLDLYEKALLDDFPKNEGVILRNPRGNYKQGRSTKLEAYLMALKPETEMVVTISGSTPLYTERDGLQSLLGSLKCVSSKKEFCVGTGFTQEMRKLFWRDRSNIVGKKIKIKHACSNAGDVPSAAVFVEFVDKHDF